MLNRRILRTKAFKVLYAYAEDSEMNLKQALARLDASCEATRDLYLFMLDLVPALTEYAASRIEAARMKFNPTQEELNPNMRFAQNGFANYLAADPDFQKFIAKKKYDWGQYDVFLRKLYEKLRQSEYYLAYMEADNCSAEDEAALFIKIFEEELIDNDDLSDILDELSIQWTDSLDLAVALTACCRTAEEYSRGRRWSLPPLYNSDLMTSRTEAVQSDKAFVVKLLTTAFCAYPRYYEAIAACAKGWDRDRLFTTDVVLIACGLAEHEAFPDLPAGVIINEYVEITKCYSTPKSRSFVNGVLDKIINNKTE